MLCAARKSTHADSSNQIHAQLHVQTTCLGLRTCATHPTYVVSSIFGTFAIAVGVLAAFGTPSRRPSCLGRESQSKAGQSYFFYTNK